MQAQVAPSHEIQFDIPAGSLQSALIAFGSKTGWQLIYAPAAVAGRNVGSLRGRYSPRVALERLIANTGMRIKPVSAKVIVLEVARTSAEPAGAVVPAPSDPATDVAAAEDYPSEEIVVTGTNIRGEQPVGSRVQSIRKSDMDRNGYASVAQAAQALPGNFGGAATEQSALTLADSSGANNSLANGINLRGLGASATLTLVDGHRIAGGGLKGDITDVSSIPMGAVERIEVLMDGASALYGSDAVGGVVNIILKKKYDGADTQIRAGTVTSGGSRQFQFDQTLGRNWNGGGIFLAYEYRRDTALASASRDFAQSSDSRAFGGTNHNVYLSLPGNILGFTAAGLAPVYAIPSGQNGTRLRPGDFLAGQVNLQNLRRDTDLTPTQNAHSVYLRAFQQLSPTLSVSLDARYSNRQFSVRSFGAMTIMSITAANPWFVSPTGSTSSLIAYSFEPEIGPIRIRGKAENLSVSGEAVLDLGPKWQTRLYSAYAKETDTNLQSNMLNSYALSEALGRIPDNPTTPYNAAVDGYFNPYGSGASNSATILSYIGSGYDRAYGRSAVVTANGIADGPLFSWAGGTAKLAIGSNFRREMFARQVVTLGSAVQPTVGAFRSYARNITAGFAELRVPLVGAGNRIPGIYDLEVSAAGRFEHYSDFGNTANPAIGVRWRPVQSVTLRGTIGTSFRAPNLRELQDPETVSMILLPQRDGTRAVVIQRSGGNADLRPECARTWTAGIDFSPSAIPGLRLGLTTFRTIFSRRIDQPIIADVSNALINPDYASFVQAVRPASNSTDLALVNSLIARAASAPYPAATVASVVDNRFVNTGRIDVSGIDVNAGYTIDTGGSQFDLGLNASYLSRYRVNLTPTSAPIERSNLAGYPARLRGRATIGWTKGGWNALLGMNYVGAYHDATQRRVSAWATFDLQMGWRSRVSAGWQRGLSMSLVGQNLFDRNPPFYDSSLGAGYDAADANALGRAVSLQLAKHW